MRLPRLSSALARAVGAAAAALPLALDAGPARAQEPPAAEPPPEASMFAKKCGSCHSLGEGDRAGPDLLGATKRRDRRWLTAFIRSPGAVIDGGDAAANELLNRFKGVRMPDQTLTDDELAALLGYVDACTTRGGCKLAFGKVKPARDATPVEIAEGRALFEGRTALANGGAACISCHSVRGAGVLGGGTLARDLTHAFARLGEQGTTSALASTPFPLMKNIYATAPLRDAEAYRIKAFLWASSQDGAPPPVDHDFLYLGVLGAMLSFGAIGAAWSNRLQGVRINLVPRGRR